MEDEEQRHTENGDPTPVETMSDNQRTTDQHIGGPTFANTTTTITLNRTWSEAEDIGQQAERTPLNERWRANASGKAAEKSQTRTSKQKAVEIDDKSEEEPNKALLNEQGRFLNSFSLKATNILNNTNESYSENDSWDISMIEGDRSQLKDTESVTHNRLLDERYKLSYDDDVMNQYKILHNLESIEESEKNCHKSSDMIENQEFDDIYREAKARVDKEAKIQQMVEQIQKSSKKAAALEKIKNLKEKDLSRKKCQDYLNDLEVAFQKDNVATDDLKINHVGLKLTGRSYAVWMQLKSEKVYLGRKEEFLAKRFIPLSNWSQAKEIKFSGLASTSTDYFDDKVEVLKLHDANMKPGFIMDMLLEGMEGWAGHGKMKEHALNYNETTMTELTWISFVPLLSKWLTRQKERRSSPRNQRR